MSGDAAEGGKVMPLARMWKYPEDVALEAPEGASLAPQLLRISANPEDHDLPWGVMLADGMTFYDFSQLFIEGLAQLKTDWSADNYWFPRMWIEIWGRLEFSGTIAAIKEKP